MSKLFNKADEDGSGSLSRDELRKILTDKKVKTWLAAMDLEVDDSNLLFDFISSSPDPEAELKLEELIDGISRLRGPARSIDVVALMRKTLNLEVILQDMQEMQDQNLDSDFCE